MVPIYNFDDILAGKKNPKKIVEMYSDWPYKVRARLFVYPEGHFGASVDD